MKKAIVLMAVGAKYEKQLSYGLEQFEKYAKKCDADLKICRSAPDPSFFRSVLNQKLLLPSMYSEYEWIFFMDLDILIGEDCPSVFDEITGAQCFGLSAVVDQRESIGFKKTVKYIWKNTEILSETHESYFLKRGFSEHKNQCFSINGGAYLCNTRLVGDLLKDAYWSDLPTSDHEEAIFAHATQKNGLFKPLDQKFNVQVIHELSKIAVEDAAILSKSLYFKLIKKIHGHLNSNIYYICYPRRYRKTINSIKSGKHILHFAGGYPYIGF